MEQLVSGQLVVRGQGELNLELKIQTAWRLLPRGVHGTDGQGRAIAGPVAGWLRCTIYSAPSLHPAELNFLCSNTCGPLL